MERKNAINSTRVIKSTRFTIHDVPKDVILTSRSKERKNQMLDDETGLPLACIGIPFRILEDNEGVEILLVKNKKNEWRFPGGTWELDETKEECVVRECLEECGIHAKVIGSLGDSLHFSRKLQRVSKKYQWFLVEVEDFYTRSAEGNERRFVLFDDVFDILVAKEMKEKWKDVRECDFFQEIFSDKN